MLSSLAGLKISLAIELSTQPHKVARIRGQKSPLKCEEADSTIAGLLGLGMRLWTPCPVMAKLPFPAPPTTVLKSLLLPKPSAAARAVRANALAVDCMVARLEDRTES